MSIYLDNAASSCPKPPEVPSAVNHCLSELCANPGRGAHRIAVAAARGIHDGREAVAGLLGVSDSANIIFTQNATDALNMAMYGLLRKGDHVVSSTIEHNAVARPLASLARSRDIDVTLVPPDGSGVITPDEIVMALRPRTRMVVLTHASNVTATIQPVAEIGAALRLKGVPLLVDAAQSAGALPLDMKSIPVDMLACTGHKSLLGPQGTGFLYLSPDIELSSVRQGGTGSNSEAGQDELSRPDRYEAGTLNAPGIAGLAAGIRYIEQQGFENLSAHKKDLTDHLMAGLSSINGVTIYGPPHGRDRVPLVSFNIGAMASTEVAGILDREFDIASRAGLHCAPGAHHHLGTIRQGVVRLSIGPYNTMSEIDDTLGALSSIADRQT